MYVCVLHVCLELVEDEEGPESCGAGVTDGCLVSHGYWELNSGAL